MNCLFRKYWYLMVVALLCCTPMAFGQQVTMTLQPSVTSNPSLAGIYTGAYPFTVVSNGSTSSIVGVCDDFADQIYINESWTANVNTFASIGSNVGTGGPMWGNQPNALQEYEEAAWLVDQMANPTNASSVSNLSFAIWQVFDNTPVSTSAFGWLNSNGQSADTVATTADSAAWWLAQAQNQTYTVGEFSNFEILTATPGSQSPLADGPPQEFLVRTPESSATVLFGADMFGLLGLAIVFRRRLLRPIL